MKPKTEHCGLNSDLTLSDTSPSPLANNAMEVDNARVDRGRIFGRECRTMGPLNGFVSTVENRLAGEVVSYENYGKSVRNEVFDVAIEATPARASSSKHGRIMRYALSIEERDKLREID